MAGCYVQIVFVPALQSWEQVASLSECTLNWMVTIPDDRILRIHSLLYLSFCCDTLHVSSDREVHKATFRDGCKYADGTPYLCALCVQSYHRIQQTRYRVAPRTLVRECLHDHDSIYYHDAVSISKDLEENLKPPKEILGLAWILKKKGPQERGLCTESFI